MSWKVNSKWEIINVEGADEVKGSFDTANGNIGVSLSKVKTANICGHEDKIRFEFDAAGLRIHFLVPAEAVAEFAKEIESLTDEG